MTFPITSIAKLLIQLATITPTVSNTIDKIRQLIDTIRKPGAGTQNQLDDLTKAIELQATVNKEIGRDRSGRRINCTIGLDRRGREMREEKAFC